MKWRGGGGGGGGSLRIHPSYLKEGSRGAVVRTQWFDSLALSFSLSFLSQSCQI